MPAGNFAGVASAGGEEWGRVRKGWKEKRKRKIEDRRERRPRPAGPRFALRPGVSLFCKGPPSARAERRGDVFFEFDSGREHMGQSRHSHGDVTMKM